MCVLFYGLGDETVIYLSQNPLLSSVPKISVEAVRYEILLCNLGATKKFYSFIWRKVSRIMEGRWKNYLGWCIAEYKRGDNPSEDFIVS